MKSFLLTFSLCFMTFLNLEAQNFVILKNGQTVEYKKYKIDDKLGQIEIKKPNPVLIKISDINYLVKRDGEIRYLKEKVNKDQAVAQVGSNELRKRDYIELEKIIEGKISIFQYLHTTSMSTGVGAPMSTTVTYSFLEKGEVFEEIFRGDILWSSKVINTKAFTEYFSDDPEILEILNSDSFNASDNNILDLIRSYNINAYQQDLTEAESKLCEVILYRGLNGQDKKLTAEIDVAGEKLTLDNMEYKKIKLPNEKLMKICISNGKTVFCDLISGSKHTVKKIEIQLKRNGEIEIETNDNKQFQDYISMLNGTY